ncbi:hypothetical protein ACIO3O_17295 [Streptomyces sp. NPDC087440]|uniref:hypothetical protein n=1 Tax=Streptomyces sp. NPDC087440 TaxID=3365790 RepID=UPI0038132246
MNNRQRKKLPRRLCAAAQRGSPGAVAALLRAGADPDVPREDGAEGPVLDRTQQTAPPSAARY